MNSLSEVLLSLPCGTRFTLEGHTYVRQNTYVYGMDVVLFCSETHQIKTKEDGHLILNSDGTIYTEPISQTLYGCLPENGIMDFVYTPDDEVQGVIVRDPFANEFGTKATQIGVMVG